MVESISYRSRKWLLQQLSAGRRADQLEKLSTSEWDIVVILDACRYDILQEVTDWPIERAVSPASCTPEWLQKVEEKGIFDDATIITANAQYEKVGFSGETESYWRTHWNDSLSSVVPEDVLDRVTDLITSGEGPIVAHLQQPHWPYIAKIGDRWHLAYDNTGPWTDGDDNIESVQVAMERGLVDLQAARRAYRASVSSVWDTLVEYLERWLNNSQSVVVTADHGETFGRLRERGFYEHPCGCHTKPLISVPWISLKPHLDQPITKDSVDARLKALGYAN